MKAEKGTSDELPDPPSLSKPWSRWTVSICPCQHKTNWSVEQFRLPVPSVTFNFLVSGLSRTQHGRRKRKRERERERESLIVEKVLENTFSSFSQIRLLPNSTRLNSGSSQISRKGNGSNSPYFRFEMGKSGCIVTLKHAARTFFWILRWQKRECSIIPGRVSRTPSKYKD